MSVCNCDIQKVYTVSDWLFDRVNFPVPLGAIRGVCVDRDVDPSSPYYLFKDSGNIDIRLLKADLLKWIVLGPSKIGGTSDSDNGWSHKDGGYTLSEEDKNRLADEANAIYEELEPESVFSRRKTIVMKSFGIKRADIPLGR